MNIVYYAIENKSNINCSNETKKAKLLLEKMLNHLNIKLPEIIISETGKPYFKDSNLYFNYSHSKNFIACAISYSEVGIDIEEKNRQISDEVANKYLDNEIDNDKRIIKWVKKEAYSKLKGQGIQIIKKINLNDIKAKNILIEDEQYICSIYCDNDKVEFVNMNKN